MMGINEYSTRLNMVVSKREVTGASFAYWDGADLHTAVAGLRNSATADPVTTDTVMHIGSITKVVNAALLMQLVDDGLIALDDSIAKHLPELRLKDMDAVERIGCGMLVNHTAGIDGDWLPEFGPDQERIIDCISRCNDLEQLFLPGEATSYCNIATVIAGYLAQRLRHTSWFTLVKSRIFEPLELRHSLADPIDAPRFRCSVGDLTNPETGRPVQTTRAFLSPSFAPAGSTLMTSASDLVRFGRALLNGGVGPNGYRILSERSAQQMGERTAGFLWPPYEMGLGWMIAPGGVLTHGGVGPGVQSFLFAHPNSGRVLALLTNCDRGGVLLPEIVHPILENWTATKKAVPRPLEMPVNSLPYEGVYENNLQRVKVGARDGNLYASLGLKMPLYDTSPACAALSDRRPTQLFPLGNGVFEAAPVIPGAPKIELKFGRPDATDRMGVLGLNYRLLKRTR